MPNSTTSGITSVKLGHRKSDLAQIAGLQKRIVHSLVIEAVDRYIEQTQARMRYEAQAIRSYENYQATGLHVTLGRTTRLGEQPRQPHTKAVTAMPQVKLQKRQSKT